MGSSWRLGWLLGAFAIAVAGIVSVTLVGAHHSDPRVFAAINTTTIWCGLLGAVYMFLLDNRLTVIAFPVISIGGIACQAWGDVARVQGSVVTDVGGATVVTVFVLGLVACVTNIGLVADGLNELLGEAPTEPATEEPS
jgi:hypothetical protein